MKFLNFLLIIGSACLSEVTQNLALLNDHQSEIHDDAVVEVEWEYVYKDSYSVTALRKHIKDLNNKVNEIISCYNSLMIILLNFKETRQVKTAAIPYKCSKTSPKTSFTNDYNGSNEYIYTYNNTLNILSLLYQSGYKALSDVLLNITTRLRSLGGFTRIVLMLQSGGTQATEKLDLDMKKSQTLIFKFSAELLKASTEMDENSVDSQAKQRLYETKDMLRDWAFDFLKLSQEYFILNDPLAHAHESSVSAELILFTTKSNTNRDEKLVRKLPVNTNTSKNQFTIQKPNNTLKKKNRVYKPRKKQSR
ncbi:hypothetical protein THOM_2302 [Trachipleistophora hominis]|uniref:Secreted protein n=1 Tax=Trachipleistophora hominis TaxID=72359 RepID=L7JTI4_TRAHO|nr:hypothetical protein THOM_2302 [Trachipleistophora hominis]